MKKSKITEVNGAIFVDGEMLACETGLDCSFCHRKYPEEKHLEVINKAEYMVKFKDPGGHGQYMPMCKDCWDRDGHASGIYFRRRSRDESDVTDWKAIYSAECYLRKYDGGKNEKD